MRLESLIATPEKLSALHLNGRYFGFDLEKEVFERNKDI
jgi:hypothetical protein